MEGNHRVQGTDNDLMDGETEGDTVVIAGQPEVLSTQAMQVNSVINHFEKRSSDELVLIIFFIFFVVCRLRMNWWI